MPRSSVVAVGTSSGLISMLPYRVRPATTSLMRARTATPTTGSPASSSTVPAMTPCFHTLSVTSAEPLALGERQKLALAPGPALAVRPGRIAVLRGLQEVLARMQIREKETAFAVRHHATFRRRRILEILRHRQPDDGLAYWCASGGVHDLADDHPSALAWRSASCRDDLRGAPSRQGEHDNERRESTCLSVPGHDGLRILLNAAAYTVRMSQGRAGVASSTVLLRARARTSWLYSARNQAISILEERHAM